MRVCVRMAQAVVFAGESFALILGGNVAGVLKIHGISWRDSEIGIAIAFLSLAVLIYVLPEPSTREHSAVSLHIRHLDQLTFTYKHRAIQNSP